MKKPTLDDLKITEEEAVAGLKASAGHPERPRLRDAADLSPEEAAEAARVQQARSALVKQGHDLAMRFAAPHMDGARAAESERREREWRATARSRARQRGVPLDDHDVATVALAHDPAAGQALDAVREFLAWRADVAARAGIPRFKGLLVVVSKPGAGKTSAGGWAVTWHRDDAAFVTAPEVSAHPRTSFSETHAQWKAWRTPDLLVIDEIGQEHQPGTVLALALERYGRGLATILAGNMTADAFFARYPDPRLESRMQQQAARGGPTLVELTCGDLRRGGGESAP